MTVTVRDLRRDVRADAEGFARVRRLALPFMPDTPEAVVHGLARARPETAVRRLIAEIDGEIDGAARVGPAHDSPRPGRGCVNVYVRPERTRLGARTLIARVAEEHLAVHGATRLLSWVRDGPDNGGQRPDDRGQQWFGYEISATEVRYVRDIG